MESAFYPVVTIENEDELEMITGYCDENDIEVQFLDSDLNSFPVQALLYIEEDDFKLFLGSLGM